MPNPRISPGCCPKCRTALKTCQCSKPKWLRVKSGLKTMPYGCHFQRGESSGELFRNVPPERKHIAWAKLNEMLEKHKAKLNQHPSYYGCLVAAAASIAIGRKHKGMLRRNRIRKGALRRLAAGKSAFPLQDPAILAKALATKKRRKEAKQQVGRSKTLNID